MTTAVNVQDPEIVAGLDLGWRDLTVTPDDVRRHAKAVGDHNPWYFDSSPFGGPVAPALFFHSQPLQFARQTKDGWVRPAWFLSNRRGTLFTKQEWEFLDAARVGEALRLHAIVVDRYNRRDREYVVSMTQIFGADQRQILQVRTFQSFLLDPDQPGIVVDKEREKTKSQVEIASADALGELAPVRKHVTGEMCMRFSGPDKNYHSDREEAIAMGFPDIVVAGPLSVCFLGQMLTDSFGAGFYRGGRLAIRFVNPLWGNDTVATHGVIRERTPEGAALRTHVDVWCEKDHGTKTIVGTASAVSPME